MNGTLLPPDCGPNARMKKHRSLLRSFDGVSFGGLQNEAIEMRINASGALQMSTIDDKMRVSVTSRYLFES